MTVDDSTFYKPGTHYCTECVGRRDLHDAGCKVPAKVQALSDPPAKPKRRRKKVAE